MKIKRISRYSILQRKEMDSESIVSSVRLLLRCSQRTYGIKYYLSPFINDDSIELIQKDSTVVII